MKVKNLIRELQNCDPNAVINVVVREGLTPDTDIWAEDVTEVVEYEDNAFKWVVIDLCNASGEVK